VNECMCSFNFFFQAEDGIRDGHVTGVQTCALPICWAGKITGRKGRVLVNGGNCRWGDINWVHYVHASYRAPAAGGALRVLKNERSEERRVGKSVELGGGRSVIRRKESTRVW